MLLAYSLYTIKAAATMGFVMTMATLAVYAVLAVLCKGGYSQLACTLQDWILEASKWMWWALVWAWESCGRCREHRSRSLPSSYYCTSRPLCATTERGEGARGHIGRAATRTRRGCGRQ